MDCIFCNIAEHDPKGQVLVNYESLGVVVFEPLNPCMEGHLLFVPKEHVINVSDLKPDSMVMSNVHEAIRNYTHNKKISDFNVIINNGAKADQSVFHLHVHLIPRDTPKSVTMPWSHQWEPKETL